MTRAAAATAGAVSVAAGAVVGVAALSQLLRYSPYEDPGALTTGLWLLSIGFLLFAIPFFILAASFLRIVHRRHQQWLATLTPEQRAAALMAEAGARAVAAVAWHEHNKREDARLTDSVMGKDRSGE